MNRFGRTFGPAILKATAAEEMKHAAARWIYDGTERTYHVVDRCKGWHMATGTLLIYTRDNGLHSSGLFKNPQYERSFHLSLSFRDPATFAPIGRDQKLSKEWVDLFFGRNARKLWVESPTYREGKASDVYHYRLMADGGWNPLLPKGEVYSKEFTAAGWKSWSDVRAAEEAFEVAAEEAARNGLVRGDDA